MAILFNRRSTISTLTEQLFDSSRTYDLASFTWLVYFEGTADIKASLHLQRSNGGEIFKVAQSWERFFFFFTFFQASRGINQVIPKFLFAGATLPQY